MDTEINIKINNDEAGDKKPDANLTNHTKRVTLDYLKEHGCTRESLEKTANARRHSSQHIIDFFCHSCEVAETQVNQECDSVSLNNINQWLELLKTADLSTRCEYEAAAALNAIVCHESHPEPSERNGIDMKEVYGFLENALTGQPQKKLNAASEAFLSREIELLIEEANSEHSDNMARRMGQQLYDRQVYNYEAMPHKISLDPLLLDE